MRKSILAVLLFLASCCSLFSQSASKSTLVQHPSATHITVTSTIAPGSLPGSGMSHTLSAYLIVRKPNGTIIGTNTASAINSPASAFVDVNLSDDNLDLGIYTYTTNWTVYCSVGKYTSTSQTQGQFQKGTSKICTALSHLAGGAPECGVVPGSGGTISWCVYKEMNPCPVNCGIPGNSHTVYFAGTPIPPPTQLFHREWSITAGDLKCSSNFIQPMAQGCTECSY